MWRIVPERQVGTAKIVHDSPDSLVRLRAQMHGQPLRLDKYTRLFIGREVWMTDAEYERRTNIGVVSAAQGNVLVAGLGIGMILVPILKKSEVQHVTVIERSQDVIDLVAPHFNSPKLTVICADIYTWKPPKGSKWDVIYFDIWPNICADNLKSMAKLHMKYGRYLQGKRWMNSWCKDALK